MHQTTANKVQASIKSNSVNTMKALQGLAQNKRESRASGMKFNQSIPVDTRATSMDSALNYADPSRPKHFINEIYKSHLNVLPGDMKDYLKRPHSQLGL